MKIELHEIPIADIVKNYVDREEEGVVGYDGKLNIRPKYQREFVYDFEKREAVIDTITKGFPLNVMYWAKNADGTFEVIDGQQRTISFCQYVAGDFSIDSAYFHSLTEPAQQRILNYKVLVYFCEGDEEEKLAWFRTINIAGEKLTEQELRNASYTGPWLSNAKSVFSKSGCAAYKLAKDMSSARPSGRRSWRPHSSGSGSLVKKRTRRGGGRPIRTSKTTWRIINMTPMPTSSGRIFATSSNGCS